MTRLAIIHKEKCKPNNCGHLCSKYCPINKKEEICIEIGSKAKIDEKTCIGCGICQNRCPLGAIEIINLPSVDEKNLIYRYGENGFALYSLPTPKPGAILGLLGRNGIGKSTAIEILAGKKQINLGKTDKEITGDELKDYFQGTELLRYFENLKGKKISYKPQNLSSLSQNIKVIDLLKQRNDGNEKEIKKLAEKLNISNIINNKLNKLSGGELQRVAILAASLGDADIFFFDEPLAYLDIGERLRVSDFLKELSQGKTLIVVEHDLLILDYLTEYLNIFYGQQACFGAVSGIKSSKEGINAYLQGFLKQENLKIRDKPLNFNFTRNKSSAGHKIADWPEFTKKFDNFKLSVSAGEIKENHVIGILGKNGTGKTSFVKCLAGLEEVEIKGKKAKLKLKLDVSYKPQYLHQDEEKSLIVRNIMIKEKINKKISAMFNLESIYQKKLEELSGGELQRFSIARCLAKPADIYLIDEPSAYLDVEERITVAKLIKEVMTTKQKTAFVVDHDLLLISYLADNVLVFSGQPGVCGQSSEILDFEQGITQLLQELDITLRKDASSGRPRINNKDSVLDREQKQSGKWVIL